MIPSSPSTVAIAWWHPSSGRVLLDCDMTPERRQAPSWFPLSLVDRAAALASRVTPDGHHYAYPSGDGEVIRTDGGGREINGSRPLRAIPYYYAPPALDVDVEQMLEACVPGGSSCDPQAIADEIRRWYDARRTMAPQGMPRDRQAAAPIWHPIETAPRDGTMLRLLVDFEDHATEDSAGPSPTIGANNFDNDGEDAWKFAGWCWTHDHFTEGTGMPIGWLPYYADATDLARVLTCVYCGHQYPQGTPAWGDAALTDHIARCEKHPMRLLREECDRLRAAAGANLFGPPIPYSPGDELQADIVLAILTMGACSCAAEIVTRESIKRFEGSVSHYCVPTRSLTR